MEDHIPQKANNCPTKLVNPIILLAKPEKDELDALKYIYIYHVSQ